jgi:hypothetical protein
LYIREKALCSAPYNIARKWALGWVVIGIGIKGKR